MDAPCALSLARTVLAHAGERGGFMANLPPIHPILVNFTAALVPSSLVADVLGRVLHRDSLRHGAWWMLLFAVVVTPLTVVAGWVWLRQMEGMDQPAMSLHKWLGTAVAALLPAVAWWRGRMHVRGQAPGTAYLAVATLVVCALTFQGHLGGTLTFGVEPPPSKADDHKAAPDAPGADDQETGHRHGGHPTTSVGIPSTVPRVKPGWSDHLEVK